MSNETPPKQTANRIQINKLWLRETLDLPGYSIDLIIDCTPQPAGRPYFVAHFNPGHQVIELEWYKTKDAAPYRTRLTMGSVKRFD